MERETKTFDIGGYPFVIKTYATAREANAIQQAYFVGSKVEVVGDQPKISEFNPAVQQEVEKALIAQMVTTFNGDDENIVERCLDLPADVYHELVAQLDTLVAKKKN